MSEELVAYFYERDDAEAVADLLPAEDLTVRREQFQGEDDDEDHPWVLVVPAGTDRAVLESLLAEYDGWLAVDEPTTVVPPALPEAPRRIKNPPA